MRTDEQLTAAFGLGCAALLASQIVMVDPADDPNEPAERSIAAAGDVADQPNEVEAVEVGDGDGYLIRWDKREWIYGEGCQQSLDDNL